MRRHTADTVITAALRHLDPAPRTDLTEADLERADAAFTRIVATPSDEPVPVEPDRPHRRRSRLLVPVGLVGAAGVATLDCCSVEATRTDRGRRRPNL